MYLFVLFENRHGEDIAISSQLVFGLQPGEVFGAAKFLISHNCRFCNGRFVQVYHVSEGFFVPQTVIAWEDKC